MYNLTWEWTWSAYCMSVVKCESGDVMELKCAQSGEDSLDSLTQEVVSQLPVLWWRQQMNCFLTDLRELTCRFHGRRSERDGLMFCNFAKLIGVPLVYKLQLIEMNFLHDCMEKLNVNLSGSKAIVVTMIVKRSLPVLPCPVEIQMRRQVIQVTVSLVQSTSYWRSIPS